MQLHADIHYRTTSVHDRLLAVITFTDWWSLIGDPIPVTIIDQWPQSLSQLHSLPRMGLDVDELINILVWCEWCGSAPSNAISCTAVANTWTAANFLLRDFSMTAPDWQKSTNSIHISSSNHMKTGENRKHCYKLKLLQTEAQMSLVFFML